MRQSTRLIVNVCLTYARMGVTVGLGLATTALALRAMGNNEFGIFGAVFAVAGLSMFISDSLGTSILRLLSLHVNSDGRQDQVTRAMATCLSMAIVLAVVPMALCLLGGTAVLSSLKLEAGREEAAWWTLQLLVAGFALSVVQTPYRMLLMARQEMIFITVADVFDSLIRLSAAILALVLVDKADPLLVFAIGTVASPAITGCALVVACARKHAVARSLPGAIHRAELSEILRFIGWDIVLVAIWRVRMTGSQLLLNWGFGTSVNAANSIALQASGYQNNVANSIGNATRPAIMSRYGQGDLGITRRLVLTSSKYMMLAMLALLIPLGFESPIIVRLWLGKDVEHAPILIFLTAIWIAINHLSAGHHIVMYAVGKLKRLTLVHLAIELALWAVAAAWILLFNGPVWLLAALTILATAAGTWVRAVIVGPEIGMPASEWIRGTVWPVVAVTAIVGSVAGAAHFLVPESAGVSAAAGTSLERFVLPGLIRLIAVVGVAGVTLPLASWFVGMEQWERQQFRRVAEKLWSSLPGRRTPVVKQPDASES